MTYVTEQTSQELRAHMSRLQAMDGWNEPLADRLYKEILELDAQLNSTIAQPVQQPSIGRMRKHVEDFARKCGWDPSGPEGAFECVQRTSYAQGLEDGYAKRVRIESVATISTESKE